MRFTPSIFTSLLKPVDRRAFRLSVERHGADAYGKCFGSWDHLVTLLFAQLTGASSLRSIATGINAQSNHHYHLGCTAVARSTLSDANKRRPTAVFSEVFAGLVGQLGRKLKRDAKDVLHLIDATPIKLGSLFDCAVSNGRIRGLKLHVMHDLAAGSPIDVAITPATVNDIIPARELAIAKGVTYVFDKAYCDFTWWTKIHQSGAFFVTRPKTNMALKRGAERVIPATQGPATQGPATQGPATQGPATQGDGFCIVSDHDVTLVGNVKAKLPVPLRCVTIKRDTGEVFTVISNDRDRSALEIASCYKSRWQIELLFRWIKQNLNITSFIATNENAVRLQILAALIAFVLIRIAQTTHRSALQPRRFVELVGSYIHARRPIAEIEKPPPINPSRAIHKPNPNQMEIAFA